MQRLGPSSYQRHKPGSCARGEYPHSGLGVVCLGPYSMLANNCERPLDERRRSQLLVVIGTVRRHVSPPVRLMHATTGCVDKEGLEPAILRRLDAGTPPRPLTAPAGR